MSSTTVIVEILVTFKQIPGTVEVVGYKDGEPLFLDPVGILSVYSVFFFSLRGLVGPSLHKRGMVLAKAVDLAVFT